MERLRSEPAGSVCRTGAIGAFASILALAAPAARAQSEAWHGVWAADPAWCAYADRIGEHDPAPILFSAGEIRGLETACRVTDVQPNPEFSFFVVAAECAGEGMTWSEVRVLMLNGADEMWLWTGGGEPLRLTRCPRG